MAEKVDDFAWNRNFIRGVGVIQRIQTAEIALRGKGISPYTDVSRPANVRTQWGSCNEFHRGRCLEPDVFDRNFDEEAW